MTDYEQWRAASPDNEARAKIAEAMGWRIIHGNRWVGRGMSITRAEPPNYFDDPLASAALLDWLAVKEASVSMGIQIDAWCDLHIVGTGECFRGHAPDRNVAALRRALALAAVKAIEAGAVGAK